MIDHDYDRMISVRASVLDGKDEKILELTQHLAKIQKVVDAQAEDDGLWFCAIHASEGYLQQELRRLHRVIEEGK
jgi:hypothetical protein